MARRPLPTLLLAALLTAGALAGCQSTGAAPPAGLLPADAAPGTYWRGDASQAVERSYLVVRTDREWSDLWARVGEKVPADLPSDRMAVAIFMGPRDTAGYGVAIERAEKAGEMLTVGFRERVPGPAEAVALVRTSPYAIRLLPRSDGPVKFQRQK